VALHGFTFADVAVPCVRLGFVGSFSFFLLALGQSNKKINKYLLDIVQINATKLTKN